jgi:hypothetical protein
MALALSAGFRTGCSPPDSDDFEAERRHWAATSWPGGRADTAKRLAVFLRDCSCNRCPVRHLSYRLASIWGDSIQIGAFRSHPSATPGWQSSSRADPSSVPAPGRTPGTGLMSGKTPGPKYAPVRHGGVEVAARKSALAGGRARTWRPRGAGASPALTLGPDTRRLPDCRAGFPVVRPHRRDARSAGL